MRRELEVMQILRTPPLGKLVIEVSGTRYASLSEINDEKAKRVILAAIGELISFAGNYEVLVDEGVAPPLAGSQPVYETGPLEQRQIEFLTRLEAERDALKNVSPPQPKFPVLSGIQSRPATTPAPEPVKQELSVAEQIDAILQKHIQNDPEMAERSIHLVQGPSGGILIDVDGKRYQKPGDIPDPQIHLLIKHAVKEWDAA